MQIDPSAGSRVARLFLVSDMFGDIDECNDHQYLARWENLLTGLGFTVHTVFLNRVAALSRARLLGRSGLQEDLHSQYLNGGLAKATQGLETLFRQESEPSTIVAFSMGGIATWLAATSLVPRSNVLLLSSTRLRFLEPTDGAINCRALFGTEDANIPCSEHLRRLKIEAQSVQGGHEFYKDLDLCSGIILPWLSSVLVAR